MATRPRSVPIAPRAGLFLEAFGHGDDVRLASNFAATWKVLPLYVRRRLLKYWRGEGITDEQAQHRRLTTHLTLDSADRPLSPLLPRIQLLRGWGPPSSNTVVERSDPEYDQGCFASVYASGFLLRFWCPVVDRMPPEVARSLIAHELAHVYQHVIRYRPEDDGELEWHADELIESWGFGDETVVDNWTADVGISKRIVFRDLASLCAYRALHGDRYTKPDSA